MPSTELCQLTQFSATDVARVLGTLTSRNFALLIFKSSLQIAKAPDFGHLMTFGMLR